MKLLMIRHFQTPGNRKKQYIGRTDEPLLEGEELRTAAAHRRAVLAQAGSPQCVIASPMKRCIQTAALLFPGREPRLCKDMKECDFGLFEGKNYEELKETPSYQEWLASRGTIPFPGGESHEAFKARCVRGFEEMVDELILEGCSLGGMVVHGGTIMAVLSAFDCKGREFYSWQVENGGGYLVSLGEKAWQQGQKEFGEIERI